MGRFVVFTHNKVDIEDYRKEFSEHDFVFLSYHRIHSDVIVISSNNLEQIFNELEMAHSEQPFHRVLFGYLPEIYVLVAEQLIKRLGLPRFIGEAKHARDKYLMIQTLSAKLKCLDSRLIENLSDLPFTARPSAGPREIKKDNLLFEIMTNGKTLSHKYEEN
jgi:hypothetical protein